MVLFPITGQELGKRVEEDTWEWNLPHYCWE